MREFGCDAWKEKMKKGLRKGRNITRLFPATKTNQNKRQGTPVAEK
jgi:hypothetical protein